MDSKLHFALAVVLAAITMQSHAAHVDGNLRDFITNLYGGTGLFLPPAPGIPQNIADAHVPHFTGQQQIQQVSDLSNGILAGTGIFALNSTTTGISFDLSKGVPVAVEDSLGPLLAERATTMGAGRLSVGFSYANQSFDELDGKSLNNIQVALTHQDCCAVGPPPIPPPDGMRTGFEEDLITLNIDIDLEQEIYALFANYGVTDRWDVGIIAPIVRVKAEAFAVASVVLANPNNGSTIGGSPVHSFDNDPSLAFSDTGGDETGLGDVILRSKLQILSSETSAMDLSLLGQLTLPTGEEDDLLGTGETKYRAMVIASKTFGRVTPHINLAYEAASSEADFENFTYAVGFDARITNRFTAAVDLIGRNNPHLESIGNNVLDLAVAVKFNPFTNRNIPINAFVSVPLNDDGLRSDVIWGLGFDIILN